MTREKFGIVDSNLYLDLTGISRDARQKSRHNQIIANAAEMLAQSLVERAELERKVLTLSYSERSELLPQILEDDTQFRNLNNNEVTDILLNTETGETRNLRMAEIEQTLGRLQNKA